MPSIRLWHTFLISFLFVVAWTAFDWFSEESRFIRFSRQAGVPVESPFTDNFVTEPKITAFISTRSYDDPFIYFEQALGLRPSTAHVADNISPNRRDAILARGADTVTFYSITEFFGMGETRIIIYHRGDEVMEMTSRSFSTSL